MRFADHALDKMGLRHLCWQGGADTRLPSYYFGVVFPEGL